MDKCDSDGVNHAGLLVGYGSTGNKDFWLVQNSWGESWGEAGYIRILKGDKSPTPVDTDSDGTTDYTSYHFGEC
jgi:hypothetical protein